MNVPRLRPLVLKNGGMIVTRENRSTPIKICLSSTLSFTFTHRLAWTRMEPPAVRGRWQTNWERYDIWRLKLIYSIHEVSFRIWHRTECAPIMLLDCNGSNLFFRQTSQLHLYRVIIDFHCKGNEYTVWVKCKPFSVKPGGTSCNHQALSG